MDRYAAESPDTLPDDRACFESWFRQGLLEEKFRKLLTDGISVDPPSFRMSSAIRMKKVKLDYAMISRKTWKSKDYS